MAAVPKHVSPWAVVMVGVLAVALVILALVVKAEVRTPRPPPIALEVRMPRIPETPTLPPPPIPVPR